MKSISTAKNQENLLKLFSHRNKQKKNYEIEIGTNQIENLCSAMYKQKTFSRLFRVLKTM